MAFPQVVTTAVDSDTITSPTVNLALSSVAGDLHVVVCRSANSESPGGSLAGFTKVIDIGRSGGGSGTLIGYLKVAAGGETTAVYTGSASATRVFQAFRIDKDSWSGDINDVKFGSLGTGTVLDPPNLSAGTALDWLWIAVGSVAGTSGNSVTGAPTNYTNFLGPTTSGTTSIGSARRELNASSENPGAFAGTPATGPMMAIFAIPPPEVFGDITYVKPPPAIGYSATNPAVPYPAGLSSGDLIALIVGQKPATAAGGGVTTPSGFTLAGQLVDSGGYGGTIGADVGNTNLYVFTKVSDGTESGNLTVTTADNSVAWGWMHRLTSAVRDAWDVAVVTGEDTSAGSVSVTFGSDPGVIAEDYILVPMVIPTDVTTPSQFSAQAFAQAGVTFDTVKGIGEPDSSLGNDIGGFVARARVLSGTSSAAPTMTATAGGTTTNVRGPAAFIRIRRVTSSGPTSGGSFLPWFM